MLAKELPLKWDLADPLPNDKSDSFVKDSILRAHEKGLNIDVFMAHLKTHSFSIPLPIALQVLSQTEDKLRPTLETKYGQKNHEIRKELLDHATQVLKNSKTIHYPHQDQAIRTQIQSFEKVTPIRSREIER